MCEKREQGSRHKPWKMFIVLGAGGGRGAREGVVECLD